MHSTPTSRMASNGIIVNDKTVAEMKRIEKSLSSLQPMGDDNVRYLWFRIDPGKPEDWGDYEQMKACGDVEDYDEYLTIVEKLYDDGIILEYGNLDKILPILKETDLVEITPSAYRYFQRDGVGSQIALWQIPEELRGEVISNTNWEKQHEVKSNNV